MVAQNDALVHMKSTNPPTDPLTLQIPLSPTIPPSPSNFPSNPSQTTLPNKSRPDQSLTLPITELPVFQPSQLPDVVVQPPSSMVTPMSPQPELPNSPPARRMVTRAQTGSLKPKQPFSMFAITPTFEEPSCYSQAVKHEHWRRAMDEEYNALIRNGT
ncbi:hypothetical protein KY290_016457 [Solanum tuberosum]|uniref:Integrase core domain containing protein n=1 Tax=Solanum tuberosum TaxID=4113 RepID=A0ABQ7V8F4_SOLTU|nr:hypothetical protein KY290_016457 [Solanum tuberosum]